MIEKGQKLHDFQQDREIMDMISKDDEAERETVIKELMRQLGDESGSGRIIYSSYPACNSDG